MKTDPQNGKAGIQAALPPSPSACQVLSVPSHQHTSIRTTNVQHNSFLADLSTYGSIFTYSSVFPWSDGKAIKLAALTRPFEEAVSALRSVEDTVICSTHEPNPWQQDDKSILSHHPDAFFTLREWTDSQFVKDEYLYDLSGDPGAVCM